MRHIKGDLKKEVRYVLSPEKNIQENKNSLRLLAQRWHLKSWKESDHQGKEYRHEEGSRSRPENLQQGLIRTERPIRKQENPDGGVTKTKGGDCYKKEGANKWIENK